MAPFSKKSKFDGPGPVRKLFTREPYVFKLCRQPSIKVSAPDCGPSGEIGNLNKIAAAGTPAELFPTLTWHFENEEDKDFMDQIKEYFVIVEDIDGTKLSVFETQTPLLGAFFSIPSVKTTISANDLLKVRKGKLERIMMAQRDLIGGFKYGENDGKVWKVPKNMHRIHFQVIALSKRVENGSLSEFPTTAGFRGAAEGGVLGWGEWVGIYEKR